MSTTSTGITIEALNRLIVTCDDSEQGFQTVADVIRNDEWRTLFTTYAQQRARFATELKEVVRSMNGTPEPIGSVSGAAHRGWINLKAVITSGDSNAILEECERAEENAVRTYSNVLEMALPTEVHDLVKRQYEEVKMAYETVRGLEHNPAVNA